VSPENCNNNCTEHRIYPFSTSVDVQMETFGIAAARQWRTLSFGVGVRYHRFTEEADTFRRDLDAPGQPVFGDRTDERGAADRRTHRSRCHVASVD
jgi:hypothetical protein